MELQRFGLEEQLRDSWSVSSWGINCRGQAGLESCSAGCCPQLFLFVQLGTTPHLEETMAQQDEESPESLQACVEVSEATLLPAASALPCPTPQPEPWKSLCSSLRDLVPRG